MKHPGPIEASRPDTTPGRWRGIAWTLVCAAGWMLLYELVDAGLIDQAAMLIIAIVVVPLVVNIVAALGFWHVFKQAVDRPASQDRRGDPEAYWSLDTMWIVRVAPDDAIPHVRAALGPRTPGNDI